MARPAHDCFRCCPSEAWPQGCCAPLTNLGFDAPEGEAGPAVAVKVSNAPEPDPLVVKSLGRPKPAVSGGSDYVMAMMEAREAAGTLVRITNSRAVGGFFGVGRHRTVPFLVAVGRVLADVASLSALPTPAICRRQAVTRGGVHRCG